MNLITAVAIVDSAMIFYVMWSINLEIDLAIKAVSNKSFEVAQYPDRLLLNCFCDIEITDHGGVKTSIFMQALSVIVGHLLFIN